MESILIRPVYPSAKEIRTSKIYWSILNLLRNNIKFIVKPVNWSDLIIGHDIKFSLFCCISTLDTAQKMKFSIKDLFSKCDQIRRFLWIWSHLLKKSLMENFILCAMRIKNREMENQMFSLLHYNVILWNLLKPCYGNLLEHSVIFTGYDKLLCNFFTITAKNWQIRLIVVVSK